MTDGTNPTVPDLVPARMLNEFVYCPRLFYLEWVDGDWDENADTSEAVQSACVVAAGSGLSREIIPGPH